MAVGIFPVLSGLDLQAFIDFPYQLHVQSPWVPPLRSQERLLLSPALHPFWQNASGRLFLAKRQGKIVGRIAAIIDRTYNAYAHEACGAFGFFECQNDHEAAHALLNAAQAWLAAQGMDFMRGPLNPSTNYTCGLLVDGFDEAPALMMPWNPPYYAELLASWQAYKEQDLLAYRIFRHSQSLQDIPTQPPSSTFSCRHASKATLKQDIQSLLSIYRRSWAKNFLYSPLTVDEEKVMIQELLPIVDCDYFVLFFHENTVCAGMVALPDLTPLLRQLHGKLSLAAPFQYLALRPLFRRGYRIMLFGIEERYRLFGLPSLLLSYMLEQARKNTDLEWVEGSWVLEDNAAICDLIEDFSGIITRRYRIYRKEIISCRCSQENVLF